ncbi:MAG: outer membrane beta-barrel protein [Candidatus Latescibacterota bacterium]|jgi:hypothetical protein
MKRPALLLLFLWLLLPATIYAQARPYIGASIGASFYDTSVEDVSGDDFKLDGNDFAWKVFGGVRTVRFLSAEGGYVDFGKIQDSEGSTALETKTTGWDLFAVGNIALGPIDVFGKAGIMWWRSDAKIEDEPFDVTGHDFTWGLGGALRLGGLGFRAEFERVELEGDDTLMMLTAGVTLGM